MSKNLLLVTYLLRFATKIYLFEIFLRLYAVGSPGELVVNILLINSNLEQLEKYITLATP